MVWDPFSESEGFCGRLDCKTQQKQAVNYETASDPEPTLNGKTIIIDAGHGGRDPGAIGFTGILEKDLTLQTANALKQQLESQEQMLY